MALMATLSKDIPLVGTVQVPSYCKVTFVVADKGTVEATMVARKDAADGQVVTSQVFRFTPDLSGPNFIAQAYLHLKSLPEFAGATDC
jgi:hypothetical protein